jgi:hypothetical protein
VGTFFSGIFPAINLMWYINSPLLDTSSNWFGSVGLIIEVPDYPGGWNIVPDTMLTYLKQSISGMARVFEFHLAHLAEGQIQHAYWFLHRDEFLPRERNIFEARGCSGVCFTI